MKSKWLKGSGLTSPVLNGPQWRHASHPRLPFSFFFFLSRLLFWVPQSSSSGWVKANVRMHPVTENKHSALNKSREVWAVLRQLTLKRWLEETTDRLSACVSVSSEVLIYIPSTRCRFNQRVVNARHRCTSEPPLSNNLRKVHDFIGTSLFAESPSRVLKQININGSWGSEKKTFAVVFWNTTQSEVNHQDSQII